MSARTPLHRLVTLDGRTPAVVGALMLVLAAGALGNLAAHGVLFDFTRLVPAAVIIGQAWRLISWPLVDAEPMRTVFAAIALFFFGRDVVGAWGSRRFALVLAMLVVCTGVIVTILGTVFPRAGLSAQASFALAEAVIVAWAFLYPTRDVMLFGALGTSGRNLGYLTVALTGIYALFGRFAEFVPDFVIEGLTAGYMFLLPRWRSRRRKPVVASATRERFRVISGGKRDDHDDRTKWN